MSFKDKLNYPLTALRRLLMCRNRRFFFIDGDCKFFVAYKNFAVYFDYDVGYSCIAKSLAESKALFSISVTIYGTLTDSIS